MTYYSIELIDINENIENFKFNKLSEDDLKKVKESFKLGNTKFLEFSCIEGEILLQTKFFRGIMYTQYQAPQRTITDENLESSVEISKLDLPKKKVSHG